MVNAAMTIRRSNERNTSMSLCSTVCCFCCQSETYIPPRCSMTKTDVWQLPVIMSMPWLSIVREGSMTYRGLDNLSPLYLFFPLCLSAAPWLRDSLSLTPLPAFGPNSFIWDLKWSGWWKLCDIFPLPRVTGCHGEWSANWSWGHFCW